MRVDFHFTGPIYSFLLMMSSVPALFAQYAEENFIRYTVKNELSDNNVTTIEQDDWGYIWVGTEIGLNRFDGHMFQSFYQNAPDQFLASSNIRKMVSLGNHRLAIVTRNGFQVLNTQNGKIQNYFIPDSTAFVTTRNLVWDIVEIQDGTFAITTSSGFYVFYHDGSLAFRHDAYSLHDIGNKKIFYGRNIFSLAGNELLVYIEENGMALYDEDQKVFTEISSSNNDWKEFSHPTASEGGPWIAKAQISDHEFIFFPRKDSIIYYDYTLRKKVISPLPFPWTDELTWESKVTRLDVDTYAVSGGYSGFFIFHLDRSTGVITFQPGKFLERYKINYLFHDKDKRLWVGTTQGLLQERLRPELIEKFQWPVNDFSNKGYVDGLLYKGMLYLGRYSRDVGLVIIDTSSMQIIKQIPFYGTGNGWNEIFSVQMYHPDTLWLGTYEGLLWFDTKSHHYGQFAYLQHVPDDIRQFVMMEPLRKDGFAWMLSYLNGVVARYHPGKRIFEVFTADSKPALPFNKVKGIAYDAYGDVWISGHSLARWNNRENYFDTLMTVYGGDNKYNDDIIVMAADESGSLWLHNAENGLLEYQIRQKKFIPYGIKDGLPSDVLRCFSPVVDHTLWIGSHKHLTRFDTRTKKMEVFDYQEGLPDRMPISREMVLDSYGKQLYMFYHDEVIRIPVHPEKYDKSSSTFIIQDVIINNELTYAFPDHMIRMKPGENNISIHYAIIDFENNHGYRFAYKFNGAKQWTELGQQRNLNLNNLSPGYYSLALRASGKSGEEKLKSFSFIIGLPFWKTGWFILICTVLLAIVIYSFYKRRISQFKQKANLDKLLSQTEMKALHAQMNPHFIFNSLNSIREMILNNETSEASRFLGNFAHLIRITLDQSRQSFISLRNTMDYLNRYIEMEKIRNSEFNFSMDADESLEPDETILPPMLIQPFIENAIWHGMNGEDKEINISVRFKKNNGQLVCIIEDDGIGIRHSMEKKNEKNGGHQSVSIANINKRIELLNRKHKLHSSVIVEDKSTLYGHAETGTIVTITLPLEMMEE